jgi:diacylglycerol kinase family enzyme
MGTLNHFAKDAGIPLDLEAAVRNLFTGQVTKVDVGEVNGRIFVNNSGVGFYPHFVRQREEQERRGHVKRVAFVLALRALVRRYLRLRMRVHLGREEALEQVTPFLFVGNNRYQTSGLRIGTRSHLMLAGCGCARRRATAAKISWASRSRPSWAAKPIKG